MVKSGLKCIAKNPQSLSKTKTYSFSNDLATEPKHVDNSHLVSRMVL